MNAYGPGVMQLLPGREKSLLRRHPWIFSGAVQNVTGDVVPGATVRVTDARGRFLAQAAYSPDSQLTGRVWTFDPGETVDAAFFRRRLTAAVKLRRELGLLDPAGGCRLVYSESDGLPGVVVDRCCDTLIVQFSSAGAEFWRDVICDELEALLHPRRILERSDAAVRKKEGLPPRSGLLRGAELTGPVTIEEDGCRFEVDPLHGQKTGFYFDLREARRVVRLLAGGRRMLNAFCYTGAFAVAALKGGVTNVLNCDSSAPALEQARRNCRLNGFALEATEFRRCDVFEELRRLEAAGEKFDLIVLDPPKLIDCRNALMHGCRAYQDLARNGFRLLNPGGILCNLSCSGLMDAELFQKITAAAALEAGADARIVGRIDQSADHPVALAVPETCYLKGLVSVVR